MIFATVLFAGFARPAVQSTTSNFGREVRAVTYI